MKGYKRQHQLQRGAPLHCKRVTLRPDAPRSVSHLGLLTLPIFPFARPLLFNPPSLPFNPQFLPFTAKHLTNPYFHLSFRVIQAQHARRDLVSSPRPVCTCHPSSPNSHGIISFADHHLLNPVISYRYKNARATGPQNSSLITRHCSQLLSYHSFAHYFAS